MHPNVLQQHLLRLGRSNKPDIRSFALYYYKIRDSTFKVFELELDENGAIKIPWDANKQKNWTTSKDIACDSKADWNHGDWLFEKHHSWVGK